MRATHTAAAVLVLALATPAAAAEPGVKAEKPLIPCDKIVETYKVNHSVDQTAAALYVDEARVAECLKAAGVKQPQEDDR
jgi:hypothetical protein